MRSCSDITTDIAVGIAAVIIGMGFRFVLFLTTGAGVPMAGLITAPFCIPLMGMGLLLHHNHSTGQTDLILFLCGSGAGIMVLDFSGCTTDGAVVPMALSAVLPAGAEGMLNGSLCTADIALGITGIVIGMLSGGFNQFRHQNACTDRTDLTFAAGLTTSGVHSNDF